MIGGCLEDICSELAFQTSEKTYQVFDLRVDFTDHTGTIANCRLWNAEAEQILGCPATDYLVKSWSQKCGLKWRFLMERCKVKVIVYKKTVYRSYSWIRLLHMELADPLEVKEKIPVY